YGVLVRHDSSCNQELVHRAHLLGLREQGEGIARAARPGLWTPERDRRGPHSHRGHRREAWWTRGQERAPVLSRLHPGRDDDVRPCVARGEEHAKGDALWRRRHEADTAQQGRGRPYSRAGENGGGKTETEVHVREGRSRADQ